MVRIVILTQKVGSFVSQFFEGQEESMPSHEPWPENCQGRNCGFKQDTPRLKPLDLL